MNERLIVKSFGPVKDLDIIFKKVTLFTSNPQLSPSTCLLRVHVLSLLNYQIN